MSRILFITSTRVGDAVLSTGLLAHLLDAYPGARVTVVCGPAAAGLFEAVPGLEEVIALKKKPGSIHWWTMWSKCVGRVWDVVVDLRNAPLSRLLLTKRRIGIGAAGKRDIHRVRAYGSIVGLEDNPPAPKLWTKPEHDETAARLIPDGGPVLAIGPTANWRGKVWMADRFAKLALRLTAADGILPDARIAVIAHDSERVMAQPVLDALPEEQTLDLVGNNGLLTVYACLKRSAFFVGNDSGLMHMAAAAGIPVLGLFGPSKEKHYAPWGPKGRAQRCELGYDQIFPDDYDHRTTESLMGTLSVDMAEKAARELWEACR